jgi:hypothetical protein
MADVGEDPGCASFRDLLTGGTIGYRGQALEADEIESYMNRWCEAFATAPTPQSECPDFTPPPYDSFEPVPGVSVRVINKGLFEVTNTTDRAYFGKVFTWQTEANLVCGQGVLGHDSVIGQIAPGSTVQWFSGSTPDVPMTVEIWDSPCGEGCYREPLGAYLLPVSSIEPVPIRT